MWRDYAVASADFAVRDPTTGVRDRSEGRSQGVDDDDVAYLEKGQTEALKGLVEVVAGVVDDLTATGESVPQPFAERSYSGTIYVRTSAEVHRRLVMEAAENHVSLNQWAAQRLASP